MNTPIDIYPKILQIIPVPAPMVAVYGESPKTKDDLFINPCVCLAIVEQKYPVSTVAGLPDELQTTVEGMIVTGEGIRPVSECLHFLGYAADEAEAVSLYLKS